MSEDQKTRLPRPSELAMEAITPRDSVGHRPEGKWEFDENVTDVFEDMLARSIPQYDVMRKAVFEMGARFVERGQQGTFIVDMGASRGGAIRPFVDRFGALNRYIVIEVSQPMLEVLRREFGGWISNKLLSIRADDLRETFPPVPACLVLSVLTLQFTPIEYRLQILQRIYDALEPGGAFIMVEKVLGETADIDDALVEQYLDMKKANGYSQDDIDKKRGSLEGVLVPIPSSMNEHFMRAAGFTKIDCFWRWMNFAAWVAVK